jgi:hypothetical protein
MSDGTEPGKPAPSSDEIVVILFQAAMSGDANAWARERELDPKLLEMWKFTHAQEYIAYLEKLLRVIRIRAET